MVDEPVAVVVDAVLALADLGRSGGRGAAGIGRIVDDSIGVVVDSGNGMVLRCGAAQQRRSLRGGSASHRDECGRDLRDGGVDLAMRSRAESSHAVSPPGGSCSDRC